MFHSLSEKLLYRMNEETSIEDIDFIPSDHGRTVGGAMKELVKMKDEWDIEILDNDIEENKKVTFENQLRISVQNEDWNLFTKLFESKLRDGGTVNLKKYLIEAMDDEMNYIRSNLKPELIRLFTTSPFDELEKDLNKWQQVFGVRNWKKQSTLISASIKKGSISKLNKNLLKNYKDDRGTMEMLIDDVRNRRSLTAYDGFDSSDFIYGGRIHSNYDGIDLIFEGSVDYNYVMSETIMISDMDIVDKIEEACNSIKVVKNVLYPKGERFGSDVFTMIKEYIGNLGLDEPEVD